MIGKMQRNGKIYTQNLIHEQFDALLDVQGHGAVGQKSTYLLSHSLLLLSKIAVDLELILITLGVRQEHTLNETPAHHTHIHTLIHT